MVRICLKNEVHTSQLVHTNIKWHFHDTGRRVRRTFKIKCTLLSWQTSLWGTVKPRFSTALRSEPGGWGSNEIRDSQTSPLREDLPTCSSEPSLVGWHERGWCWQGAGRAIHGHPWWEQAGFFSHTQCWQSHPDLPGARWLSRYCQARREICSTRDVWSTCRSPQTIEAPCALGHD